MSDHKYSFAIIFTVWGNFYFWTRISKEYFRRIVNELKWTITWTFMVSRLERKANSSVKIRYFEKIVETICQKFIFRGLISWQSAETEWSPLQFCRGRLFNEKTTTNGISNVKFQKFWFRIWNIFWFRNTFQSFILGYCLSKLG